MSGYITPSDYTTSSQINNSENYNNFCSSLNASCNMRPIVSTYQNQQQNQQQQQYQQQQQQQQYQHPQQQMQQQPQQYQQQHGFVVDSNMPYLSDRNLFSAGTRQQSGQYPQVPVDSNIMDGSRTIQSSYLSQFELERPNLNKAQSNGNNTSTYIGHNTYNNSSFSEYNSNRTYSQQKPNNQMFDNNPMLQRVMDMSLPRR